MRKFNGAAILRPKKIGRVRARSLVSISEVSDAEFESLLSDSFAEEVRPVAKRVAACSLEEGEESDFWEDQAADT